MTFQRIHKPSSSSLLAQKITFPLAPRPFAIQAMQKSDRPPTQEEAENQAFRAHKFEATGLEMKAQAGTIAPEEREGLTALQAKMNQFWVQRMERALRFGHNFANIPVNHPEDNRPEVIAQRKLLESVNNSPQVRQAAQIQEMANNSPQIRRLAQIQEMIDNNPRMAAQRKRKQREGVWGAAVHKKENNTGLPDRLKAGVEYLSGLSMDDVKVHQNSSGSDQLHAHTYTLGTDIHIATGQEQHLPHEAWHVV